MWNSLPFSGNYWGCNVAIIQKLLFLIPNSYLVFVVLLFFVFVLAVLVFFIANWLFVSCIHFLLNSHVVIFSVYSICYVFFVGVYVAGLH